jgi:hypothetical protein
MIRATYISGLAPCPGEELDERKPIPAPWRSAILSNPELLELICA